MFCSAVSPVATPHSGPPLVFCSLGAWRWRHRVHSLVRLCVRTPPPLTPRLICPLPLLISPCFAGCCLVPWAVCVATLCPSAATSPSYISLTSTSVTSSTRCSPTFTRFPPWISTNGTAICMTSSIGSTSHRVGVDSNSGCRCRSPPPCRPAPRPPSPPCPPLSTSLRLILWLFGAHGCYMSPRLPGHPRVHCPWTPPVGAHLVQVPHFIASIACCRLPFIRY